MVHHSRLTFVSTSIILVVGLAAGSAWAQTSEPTTDNEMAPESAVNEPAVDAESAATDTEASTEAAPTATVEWRSFRLAFDGYLRVEASTFVPDRFFGITMPSRYKRESLPTVGRSDGFGMGDARLNLRGTYGDKLYVRLGFDGAIQSYADTEDSVGHLDTGLKDAYMRFALGRQLAVFAGRFKPPFDVEGLTATDAQYFVHRAVESRGVRRQEGPHADLFGRSDVSGFAPGRQIGVMVADDAVLGDEDSRLGYSLAMTNGNSGDAVLNDNDLPAFWLRLVGVLGASGTTKDDEEGPATYNVQPGVTVGLGGFYNELTTVGWQGDRYSDRIMGAGFDVAVRVWLLRFQGQVLAAQISSRNLDVPDAYALGGHAQLAVEIPGTGLFPAYRFAVLDPRHVFDEEATAGSTDIDRVMHHTLGAGFRSATLPLVFYLEYTMSIEQAGRSIPNDRVEAAVQVTFQ